MSDFIDQLGDICENTANVVLDGLKKTRQESVPAAFWERDRRAIEAELGSDLAPVWLHNCVYVYTLESAYELTSIATLLKTRRYHVSIYPLVRSIIERIGVVNWILSEEATHRQRALRSTIAYVVSIDPYVKTLKEIKAEAKHQVDNQQQQVLIESSAAGWFGEPVKIDPDTSKPTADRTKWSYEGESYPGFNKLCKLSLERGNVTRRIASALYDGFSGFTHPNLFFGREHLLTVDGRVTLSYDDSDLEKSVRLAVGAVGEGIKRWATYFEAETDAVIASIDALSDKLDEISVLRK
jgi:hypothetical protein